MRSVPLTSTGSAACRPGRNSYISTLWSARLKCWTPCWVKTNPTVWTVARALTWSRGWESLSGLQLRLALSETAAHLAYLRSLGEDIPLAGLPSLVA